MTPSQAARRRKRRPLRTAGEFYTVVAYDRAIRRACAKAGVPVWKPHQLRHNAATRITSAYGIELAKIILGHKSIKTTEIYDHGDLEKAAEIMAKSG